MEAGGGPGEDLTGRGWPLAGGSDFESELGAELETTAVADSGASAVEEEGGLRGGDVWTVNSGVSKQEVVANWSSWRKEKVLRDEVGACGIGGWAAVG